MFLILNSYLYMPGGEEKEKEGKKRGRGRGIHTKNIELLRFL